MLESSRRYANICRPIRSRQEAQTRVNRAEHTAQGHEKGERRHNSKHSNHSKHREGGERKLKIVGEGVAAWLVKSAQPSLSRNMNMFEISSGVVSDFFPTESRPTGSRGEGGNTAICRSREVPSGGKNPYVYAKP